MDTYKKYWSIAPFLFICLANITAYLIGQNDLQTITKMLMVPGVFWFYLSLDKNPSYLVQIALCFSWIGDGLYIFNPHAIYVKCTVISYFMMYVFLIVKTHQSIKYFTFRYFIMGLLLFASYLAVFLNRVYVHLDDMKIYAIVYGLNTSYVGSLALMYFFQFQSKLRIFLFFGVLIYSMRDVMLTFNTKVFDREFFTIPVTITYAIALVLITLFFVNESHTKSEND